MNYQKDHQKCTITCDLSASFSKNDQKINKYLYLREFKKVFTLKLMFFPEVSEN